MKNVIPYTKEIIFKSNIGEISSISLEHEEDVVASSIEGIFKVSGEYKTHEISVNKENFSYDLPFSIELDEDIDTSSVVVDIEDFNYSFTNDVLKVNIEFSVTGERIKEEVEEAKEEIEEKEETRNEVVFDETILDKINEIETKEKEMTEVKEEIEEAKEEVEEVEEAKEEVVTEEKSVEEQEYITYHVHILKEEETVESVCKMYGTSESIVAEYNDLAAIKTGDKLIIPEVQDE